MIPKASFANIGETPIRFRVNVGTKSAWIDGWPSKVPDDWIGREEPSARKAN